MGSRFQGTGCRSRKTGEEKEEVASPGVEQSSVKNKKSVSLFKAKRFFNSHHTLILFCMI
jgi:hypothetical protein